MKPSETSHTPSVRGAVFGIVCPHCGAAPFSPCLRVEEGEGRPMEGVHAARRKAGVAAAQVAPMPLSPDAVDRALRAHWPSYDRMRPDIARKWRAKMEAALRAALMR